MKKRKVTIVDYNAGNILSVSRAFEACGVEVELTNDQKKIAQASFLVLPGDGSFNYATNVGYVKAIITSSIILTILLNYVLFHKTISKYSWVGVILILINIYSLIL